MHQVNKKKKIFEIYEKQHLKLFLLVMNLTFKLLNFQQKIPQTFLEPEGGLLGEVDESLLVEGGLNPAVVKRDGQAVVGPLWEDVERVGAPVLV